MPSPVTFANKPSLAVVAILLTPVFATAQEPLCHDQWPAWSPDGESIVFTSTVTGDHELYTLSLATGRTVRLTDVPGRDAHPAWSPDGARIAFQSPRLGNGTHLYVSNARGGEQRRVTTLDGFSGMPVWSPDGGRLAFQHRAPDDGSPWNLRTVSLDDGGITDVTDGAANDQVVNWSPDGRRLLFHSDRTGTDQLYVWEEGAERRLTGPEFENKSGAWSPGGDRIAFVSARNGDRGIYLMRADGSGQRRVGDVSIEHGVPFFSPDGTRLLITPTTATGTVIGTLDIETGVATLLRGPCDAGRADR